MNDVLKAQTTLAMIRNSPHCPTANRSLPTLWLSHRRCLGRGAFDFSLTTGEVTTRAKNWVLMLRHTDLVRWYLRLRLYNLKTWFTFAHSERCQTQSSNLWAVLKINLSNSYQQTWTLWWYIFKDTTSLLCIKDAVMWPITYYIIATAKFSITPVSAELMYDGLIDVIAS